MCFHSKLSKPAEALAHRFNATFENSDAFVAGYYNGFTHPQTPVINCNNQNKIQLYYWGLIPQWAKDDDIKKYTLNARLETLHQKPAFRNVVQNRCLIISDGFFEWKWLDEKGKQKQKYLITLADNEIFTFGGLFSQWTDKSTGEILDTYTIITQPANALMRDIHNSKKRMPLILTPDTEMKWLEGEINEPVDVKLNAEIV